jgi:hypothetical protein
MLAMRDRIASDLDTTQGAWRRRSALHRFGLLASAALVGVVPWLAASTTRMTPPTAMLLLAGSGAVGAIAVSTQRPGFGSGLAFAAAFLGLLAAALEAAAGGLPADPLTQRPAFACLRTEFAALVLPAALAAVHLVRSGLPLRVGHGVAVGMVGVVGCALVWSGCRDDRVVHRALEHGLGVVGLCLLATVIFVTWWRARTRRMASLG